MSEVCSWARYTVERSTEPLPSESPRRHQRCRRAPPRAAGQGTGEGDGARGGHPAPHALRPARAAGTPPPRRSPSAARHRDRAEGGTGSGKGGWEAQEQKEAGAHGAAAQRFREGRATENRQTPRRPRPHATRRTPGRRALSLMPSIHAPTGHAARTGPAAPGTAPPRWRRLPYPPNAEAKLRCASASGPRARACARTLRAGRKTPRPRDPAPSAAAAPARAARHQRRGARGALQVVRMRCLPWAWVCGARLSRSDGAV